MADEKLGWVNREVMIESDEEKLEIVAGSAATLRGTVTGLPERVRPAGSVRLTMEQLGKAPVLLRFSDAGLFTTTASSPPSSEEPNTPATRRSSVYQSPEFLESGTYKATFHIFGMPEFSQMITLNPGDNPLCIEAPQTGTLDVHTPRESDMSDSSISLLGKDKPAASLFANSRGEGGYRYEPLLPGAVKVFFWAPKIGWAVQEATISGGETTTVSLQVQAGGHVSGSLALETLDICPDPTS